MYRMVFAAYKKEFKVSFTQDVKNTPKHLLIIVSIWLALLILTFCTSFVSASSDIMSLAFSCCLAVITVVMYAAVEANSYKNVYTNIENKRERIREVYIWLKRNRFFTKNQIKQLHNELRIEIERKRADSVMLENRLFKIFEILCIPVVLGVFTHFLEIKGIYNAEQIFSYVINLVIVFFTAASLFLSLYIVIMRINRTNLEHYEGFAEALQDVLDTQFRIRDEDILSVSVRRAR